MNVPSRDSDRHNWETLTPLAAFVVASWVVDRATEVRRVLEERLNWHDRRQVTLRTLLIGKEMLAMLGRRGHHRQVRLALRSLPFPLQRRLNVVDGRGNAVSYRQIEKPMRQIAAILADPTVLADHDHPPADAETGEVLACPVTCRYMAADHNWYLTAMAQASRPDEIPAAMDMVIDWSDMEAWAKPLFHFTPDAPTAAGDVGDDYHSLATAPKPKKGRAGPDGTMMPLAPLGPDGRRVPTKDEDARYGHRSRRPGVSPHFVGWDNNTMVGAPDRNGRPTAPFLYAAAVVPASSYAGDSAIEMLRLARHFGIDVRDLIADRGYTRLDPDRFCRPAQEFVDDIVSDLLAKQWRRRVDHTVIRDEGKPTERVIRIKKIAGGFFTSGLPDSMDDLARPGFGASKAEREQRMAEFDRRAQFSFVRHGQTQSGAQRWAGPATPYAGYKVRCPNNPRSMRAPHKRPLTSCPPDGSCSCGEVVVIDDPSTEREQQRLLWGTTKWYQSYCRRTTVERAYADDKVQVTEFDRGTIYCFGTVKQALYYSPTLVARNIQVALRWYMENGLSDPWDIARLCEPGYEFTLDDEPQEVDAHADEPGGGQAQAAGEKAEPQDDVDDEASIDDGTAPDETGASRRPMNRAQRRAAARKDRTARPPAKPSKPPPGRPKPEIE